MSLPEHHLDLVYTPGSIEEKESKVPRSRVLGAMLLPLFFIIAFTTAYSSALHAPKPHDLALTIVGPAATTQQIATAIDKQASGGFDITRTTDENGAIKAVQDRSAVGAIVIGSGSTPTVTSIVAGGGGKLASQAVQQVGTTVALQLKTTATVRDVAPTSSGDSTGSSLFYLVLLCTVGGYLTITVLFQAYPNDRKRNRVLTALAAAVFVPLLALVAMSFSVGVYGMDFGHLAAVAGTMMLYTLVAALFGLFMTELLGQAAIFAIVLFLMVLNFPSTGGSAPESMLPAFWQAIHAVWMGSGALEAVRSFVYFGGNGFGWPFVRILLWTAGLTIALTTLYITRSRRLSATTKHEQPTQELDHTSVSTTAAAPALS